ncbi:hypothetical protein EJ04DRAFT_516982 [Polyplosphaeria fusca]|uniref:Uncharacterized protein n=1 Tax=Polyplosphaeria fusca TaxID=682080 RepID=A0A9P4QN99_9PLEO|nr:hypothetical protein EJ04DRAFT_516982 [Polyplosphaeria fusca]
MDRQYPDHARYDRYSRTTHSVSPTRPEPVASTDARGRRRSAKITGPRSIPHSGAKCDNNICSAPYIAADDRLCPGPEGLQLCSACYKRFKIERRRAREAQRAITDDWKKPKRLRPKLNTASTEDSQKSATTIAEAASPDHSQRDLPPAFDETHARQTDQYHVEAPISGPSGPHSREPIKQPSPVITPWSRTEKTSSLHNFPTSSLNEYGRQNSRPPRRHRSRRERDDEKYMRNGRAGSASTYGEAEFYKYGRAEEGGYYDDQRYCCSCFGRKRKCVIIGLAVVSAIVLIIIIALAATLSRKRGFNYTASTAQVNNTMAFDSGGATRKSVNDTSIGIGAGTDTYTYYQGNASLFPPKERWVSFQDMWDNNLDTFKYSCGWLGYGKDNTPEIIQDIYNAIQDRANASLVDHRIILATIIQETNGCPLNPSTTSSGGTRNPGLMQSHNGHDYDSKHSRLSILLMVQDGTQGTKHGWGLVDNLNTYGNPYKAMRGYNR